MPFNRQSPGFGTRVSNPQTTSRIIWPVHTFTNCVYYNNYTTILSVKYITSCYFSTCDQQIRPQQKVRTLAIKSLETYGLGGKRCLYVQGFVLNMAVSRSSETLVPIFLNTERHTPDNCISGRGNLNIFGVSLSTTD